MATRRMKRDRHRRVGVGSPLVLYSTCSSLAFLIAQRFYREVHWVWCSPFFRDAGRDAPAAMPPSAIPGRIYDRVLEDVTKGDRHSDAVQRNRIGLVKGAYEKHKAGVIGKKTMGEILAIINAASPQDFRPLVYVIPFALVRKYVVEVPPIERAHPMSVEYRIEKLPRGQFDVIEPRETKNV